MLAYDSSCQVKFFLPHMLTLATNSPHYLTSNHKLDAMDPEKACNHRFDRLISPFTEGSRALTENELLCTIHVKNVGSLKQAVKKLCA